LKITNAAAIVQTVESWVCWWRQWVTVMGHEFTLVVHSVDCGKICCCFVCLQ